MIFLCELSCKLFVQPTVLFEHLRKADGCKVVLFEALTVCILFLGFFLMFSLQHPRLNNFFLSASPVYGLKPNDATAECGREFKTT